MAEVLNTELGKFKLQQVEKVAIEPSPFLVLCKAHKEY